MGQDDLFSHMNLFADIATNHRGDLKTFAGLAQEIQDAGAIVKVQLFSEETFPREWVKYLGTMPFVPSVFRPEDVDFILPYKPLALKVASVEATYWKLIERCCETDLPLIVSTGGMNEDELGQLYNMIYRKLDLCLMHCVSIYPTPKEQINLGRLALLSEEVEGSAIVIGWSSHYPMVDPAAYALAWAWGATQFEVHVRTSKWPLMGLDSEGNTVEVWPNEDPEFKLTLDEQCAFTPNQLRQIRTILESLPVLEGSDDYEGPDREAVVEWRKRWN